MSAPLPPLRLTGATVLRDGRLQQRSVALAGGVFTRGPLPEIDLTGYLLLPGIVDLHARGLERHRSLADDPAALAAADRDAASNGITTQWLAQDWSWEGGARSPEAAEALLAAHAALRGKLACDLRVQLCVEIRLVGDGARLIAAAARRGVGWIVFSDRMLPLVEAYRRDPGAVAPLAQALGRDPESVAEVIRAVSAVEQGVPRHLCRLAEAFDALGVVYGSDGDRDAETRERHSMIGARVAQCPGTRRAAAAACAMGSPVLAAAPGLMPRRAPAGQAMARDLLAEGLCDALVSGDRPASLIEAALALAGHDLAGLPRAWSLVSARPAEILRLHDRGRIEPGLRADLAVVNPETRLVEATIAGGRLAYLSGEAGRRFLSSGRGARIAAE